MAEIIGKNYKANFGRRIDESDLEINLESTLIILSRLNSYSANPYCNAEIDYLRQSKDFCYAICSQDEFKITGYISLERKILGISIYGSMEEEIVKKILECLFSARNIETKDIYSSST